MKILSGVCHEEIEGYIRGMTGISVLDTVGDQELLLEMADDSYDVIMYSRELAGSLEPKQLMKALRAKGSGSPRIAVLYGEYDDYCDNFVSFLIENGIYDFHVGGSINSNDIKRILFKATGKAGAIGYAESRYDAGYFDRLQPYGSNDRSSLFHSFAAMGRGLKHFFKTDVSRTAYIGRQVISIISNQATGKSHTAWNLACCLSEHGYATSLLNIDRGYSANCYFGIDEIYHNLLEFKLRNNEHNSIINTCYRRKKLSVIAGKPGDSAEISEADFTRLLYAVRTRSEVSVIDTRTGVSALTRLSVKSSDCDLLVFDCDLQHFHMNMQMLHELQEDFVPEKTIAVINNTNIKSPGHKRIYNRLADSGIPFRDIAFIGGCGLLSSELMSTGLSPYNSAREESRELVHDMEELLVRLSEG